MSYFSELPRITYKNTECVDITIRAKIRDALKSNVVIFYPYVIQDGERPDIIAHKYYGNSEYAWIIMFTNERFDLIYDWPLPYQEFVKFLIKKYGSVETAMTTVNHYKNSDGLIIDYTTYLSLDAAEREIVYNYEYELEKNESKRQINLIDKNYLQQILTEFRGLV